MCGACWRYLERRKGRDPRAIDRHFKWKAGHDPNDAEADPSSPYVYLDLQPGEAPAPPSQKAQLGGPPAGVDCFDCLGAGRGRREVRLGAAVDPYTLLEPAGFKLKEDTVKTKEKVIITICSTCDAVVHWRESEYLRARANHDRQA